MGLQQLQCDVGRLRVVTGHALAEEGEAGAEQPPPARHHAPRLRPVRAHVIHVRLPVSHPHGRHHGHGPGTRGARPLFVSDDGADAERARADQHLADGGVHVGEGELEGPGVYVHSGDGGDSFISAGVDGTHHHGCTVRGRIRGVGRARLQPHCALLVQAEDLLELLGPGHLLQHGDGLRVVPRGPVVRAVQRHPGAARQAVRRRANHATHRRHGIAVHLLHLLPGRLHLQPEVVGVQSEERPVNHRQDQPDLFRLG